MRYGSLFSGAGGCDLGLDAAGMTCAFQCEIDKQARAVLRHRWPEVPKYEDVRALSAATLPRVELLVGGFPCQDLSVAGKRAGLAGERSGLFYEFMRLVSELAPEWVLIENVPGLLSSHGGRDMGAVLGTLGELGYGWAYRSLDAQYFRVAQRRKRVFIVGRAGGRSSPVEVLFERESLPWNPPPRRKAKEDVASTLGGGFGDTDRMTFIPDVLSVSATSGVPRPVPSSEASTIGFNARQDPDSWYDRTGPLDTDGSTQAVAFAENQRAEVVESDTAGSLNAGGGKPGQGYAAVRIAHGVRRLTPRECERLQGWPNDHTLHGVTDDGRRIALADGPRYRMIGNGVASPVAAWIARRMVAQ